MKTTRDIIKAILNGERIRYKSWKSHNHYVRMDNDGLIYVYIGGKKSLFSASFQYPQLWEIDKNEIIVTANDFLSLWAQAMTKIGINLNQAYPAYEFMYKKLGFYND